MLFCDLPISISNFDDKDLQAKCDAMTVRIIMIISSLGRCEQTAVLLLVVCNQTKSIDLLQW